MGFFDKMRESKDIQKKAEWKIGLIPTIIELNEDHMKLTGTGVTDIVFYKDIMSIEQAVNVINIKTNVKTFSIRSRKLRGGTDKATELYQEVLERMSEQK